MSASHLGVVRFGRPARFAGLARIAGLVASLGVSGCAALWSGAPQQRVDWGPATALEKTAPLQGEALRELDVAVDGLRAEVRLAAVERCVQQRWRQQTAVERRWTAYPRWTGWVAAAEAGLGLAAWQLADREALGASAQPLLWSAVAVAGAAAAIDALAAAGALDRPQQRALPSREALDDWRVVPCGRAPLAAAAFSVHGGRADWPGAVDLAGRATLDLAALPPRSFPYQSPFAELSCDGCRRVALTLGVEAAARLVLARQDVDDQETWLLLHPGQPQRAQVAAARSQLLQQHAQQRQQALHAAQVAMQQGDLAAAAQLVRACQAVARTPAPACDALERVIDDRFVQQQLELGRQAVERGDLPLAEAALYRCTLLDGQRPGCVALQRLIAEAREDRAQRAQAAAAAADHARDQGLWLAVRRSCRPGARRACRAALARCLAANPEHAACLRLQAGGRPPPRP